MTNYWILNHKFSSYLENNDVITLPGRKERITKELLRDSSGKIIPKYDYYKNLKIGDRIAYYCTAPKQAVIGLFEITDGPDYEATFAQEWSNTIQFKIRPINPIVEENRVSFNDLVRNLSFFKDKEGEVLEGRSASMKLWGTLKEIDKKDFNRIVELYTQTLGREIPTPTRDNLHIEMIKTTHLQANQFQCFSFIGTQERNRVYGLIPEDEIEGIADFNELPAWISDIGNQLGTLSRLIYIDNLWFFQESPGFFIPFAAFEHEKDGNLRGVMDRFSALNNTLGSNSHFEDINPLYFLVAKDSSQAESYRRKISEHGEWNVFKNKSQFFICSIEKVRTNNPKYVQTLTQYLIKK